MLMCSIIKIVCSGGVSSSSRWTLCLLAVRRPRYAVLFLVMCSFKLLSCYFVVAGAAIMDLTYVYFLKVILINIKLKFKVSLISTSNF